MKRYQIALYISIGATVLSIIGFIVWKASGNSNIGGALMALGFLAGVVSYIFGGLLTAVKMVWDIAKWAFIIVRLPYSLIIFIFTGIFAAFAFFFLPVIPVYKAFKERKEFSGM